MVTKIIRAYDLKPGDLYIKQGIKFHVRKIKDGQIYYAYMNTDRLGASTIGEFSQERVELIIINRVN